MATSLMAPPLVWHRMADHDGRVFDGDTYLLACRMTCGKTGRRWVEVHTGTIRVDDETDEATVVNEHGDELPLEFGDYEWYALPHLRSAGEIESNVREG